MNHSRKYDKAVAEVLEKALSLGDPRLIEAILPLSGKPSKVEEYKLYRFITDGDVDKVAYYLKHFSISIGSGSLRKLLVECFLDDDKSNLLKRSDIFSLFVERGLGSLINRRAAAGVTLARIFNFSAIANTAEHLLFADDVFTFFYEQKFPVQLDDILTLIDLPYFHLSDEDRQLYAAFFIKWLGKLDDKNEKQDSPLQDPPLKSELMRYVVCIGTPELVKVAETLFPLCKDAYVSRELEVSVDNIAEIAVIKALSIQHPDLLFTYPAKGYQSIEDYFLRETASHIIWLLQRGDCGSHYQMTIKLYNVLQSISNMSDRDAYMEKMGFVVRGLSKTLDADMQLGLTYDLTSAIERAQAITDGPALRETLIAFGLMVNDSFKEINDSFMPVIGMLALSQEDIKGENYYLLMSSASRYRSIDIKRNMLVQMYHAKPKNLGDVVQEYSKELYARWRLDLPLSDYDEADVLKILLKKPMDSENSTLFYLMSNKNVINHIAKTRSVAQRRIILEMKNWQGIDVIKMAKEVNVKLPDAVKVEMMACSL